MHHNIYDQVNVEEPYIREIILFYKVNPCSSITQNGNKGLFLRSTNCPQHPCFQFHDDSERRRNPFTQTNTLAYENEICPAIQNGQACLNEDGCRYCHTDNELFYHPKYYKMHPCSNCKFPNQLRLCPFLHENEKSRLRQDQNKKNGSRKGSSQGSEESDSQSNEFNINEFKTKKCYKKKTHDPKFCFFYHNDSDRRRDITKCKYSADLCPRISAKQPCNMKDKCPYAHNKLEELYHPDRFKRKFCSYYPKINKCPYKHMCSFAHSENEIKIELLHTMVMNEEFYLYKYKTVSCPYITDHNRNECIYSHNAQDFRRSPREKRYSNQRCNNWNIMSKVKTYEEGGCPNMLNCDKCHGWKEFEFHPDNYKTIACKNEGCDKKNCPFYHNEHERKTAKVDPNSNLFCNGNGNLNGHNQFNNNNNNANQNLEINLFQMPTNQQFQNFQYHQMQQNHYQYQQRQQYSQLSGLIQTPPQNKNPRKPQSNYNTPVVGNHQHNYFSGDFQTPEKFKASSNRSTRPSSNLSSQGDSEDEKEKNTPYKGKKSKKYLHQSPMSDKTNYRFDPKKNPFANIPPFPGFEDKGADDNFDFGRYSEKLSEPNPKRKDSHDSGHSFFDFNNIPSHTNQNTDPLTNLFIQKVKKHNPTLYEHAYPLLKDLNAQRIRDFNQYEFQKYPEIKPQEQETILSLIKESTDEQDIEKEIHAISIKNQSHEDATNLLQYDHNEIEDNPNSVDSFFGFIKIQQPSTERVE